MPRTGAAPSERPLANPNFIYRVRQSAEPMSARHSDIALQTENLQPK